MVALRSRRLERLFGARLDAISHDLNLHLGRHYYSGAHQVDGDFLRSCGLYPRRHPWRGRFWFEPGKVPRRLRTADGFFVDFCVCGLCPPNSRSFSPPVRPCP